MKKINRSVASSFSPQIEGAICTIQSVFGSPPDEDRRRELAALCGEYSRLLQTKRSDLEDFEKLEGPLPPPMPCKSYRVLDEEGAKNRIIVGHSSNILEPHEVFPGSLFVEDGRKMIGLYCPSVTHNGVTCPALAETQIVEKYLPSLLRSIAYTKERLKDAA